jgi:hypothetical protein
MAFSDIVTGKYKLAHRGPLPAGKLGEIADVLKLKKKDKDALMKIGKVYLVHHHAKKGPKKKA